MLTLVVFLLTLVSSQSEARPPNFVLIFTDDQGYNDIGCFGSPKIKTPHLDRMAKEGRKFTSFYSANSVCSASRAALPIRLQRPQILCWRPPRGRFPIV